MTVEQFIQTWGSNLTAGQRNIMRDHLARMCTTEGWNDVSMEAEPRARPVVSATEDHPAIYRDGKRLRSSGAEDDPAPSAAEGAKDVPFEVEVRDTPPPPPPQLGTGEGETVE